MLTINQVREDLKEIRYYYSMQDLFDSAANTVKPIALLNKVERYNAVIKTAPARLYILYIELYVKNTTQSDLANAWGYERVYITELNTKLVQYLQKAIA
jgi:hypothetical protein